MGFPLAIGGERVDSGPALVARIIEDVRRGGGATMAWVEALIPGSLSPEEARGLSAALIQRGIPESVAVGARLARHVGDRALAPLLVHALAGHDVGLLLARDPLDAECSIEDTVSTAAAAVADLEDPLLRGPILAGLRNASLPELELAILAQYGDPDQIRRWLPAILAETLDSEALKGLSVATARGGDVAVAVAEVLAQLEPAPATGVGTGQER